MISSYFFFLKPIILTDCLVYCLCQEHEVWQTDIVYIMILDIDFVVCVLQVIYVKCIICTSQADGELGRRRRAARVHPEDG